MTLGETLDFPDGAFDATICVGVLTLGHAPARSLHELARVTRPGGHVVFTLRPDVYENNGFREVQDVLAATGRWAFEEVSPNPWLPCRRASPTCCSRCGCTGWVVASCQ